MGRRWQDTRKGPRLPLRSTQLRRIRTRIQVAILLLLGMHAIAVTGFYLIGNAHSTFADALHMAMITITTVGYGEAVPLPTLGNRMFAGLIAIAGFGTLTFLFTSLAAFFLEADFDSHLRRRRMEKAIHKLDGHYIICGFGRVGRNVAEELKHTERAFVAIDNEEPQLLEQAERFRGLLYLHGDASDDDLLLAANIDKAAGVFAVTGDDSRNLMIVITARQLNPSVRIVARCHEVRNERKLRKAGANSVISPDFTGGIRIAASMIRPHVQNFIDEMLRSERNIRLEEFTVPLDAPPRTLGELRRHCPDCVFVALRDTAAFVFNPDDATPLQSGQVLIVMLPPHGRQHILSALHP